MSEGPGSSLGQRTLDRLVIGFVITGFLALAAAAVIGLVAMARNLDFTYWVTHTYQVQNAIADYRILNERLETSRRGYLLSSEPAFVKVYKSTEAELPKAIDRIHNLTEDSPQQQARIAKLRELQAAQLAASDASVAQLDPNRPTLKGFDADHGVALTREIRQLTAGMEADENAKLVERDKARIGSVRSLAGVGLAAGLLLIFVAFASTWIILRYTRDLSRSRAALARLNLGLEDEVKVRTAELRRANDEIQRFAYIVSHDLRSPLVNVMGFTSELEAAAKPLTGLLERAEQTAPEIVTNEARLAVTSDLPESLGFIRASTAKMDRLINAILRLSREGRRVLTPETVDLQRLFLTLVDTMQHRVDELGATIEVGRNLPSLVSDRLALEQVFSNLVENALKYLKAGRPGRITVTAERRNDRVIVQIADNGRGIDPKDHERIFDLFRRSGAQDQPGEGIGLAHVRALGYRLGATVTVESALDQGATFRISLPAIMTNEAAAE